MEMGISIFLIALVRVRALVLAALVRVRALVLSAVVRALVLSAAALVRALGLEYMEALLSTTWECSANAAI